MRARRYLIFKYQFDDVVNDFKGNVLAMLGIAFTFKT